MNLFTGESLEPVTVSTAMDFVSTLKSAHQAQAQWAELEIEQRIFQLEQVGKWIQSEKLSIAEKLSQAQGLSQDFVLQYEVMPAAESFLKIRASYQKLQALKKSDPEYAPFPLGMISLLLPQHMALRFFAEKASEGLLAGNGFFVKASPQNTTVSEILKNALKNLPSNLASIFNGDHDLGQLLVSHPAIKGVIAMGRSTTAERISKLVAGSWKKLQINSGYHNSALILSETNLTEAIPQLIESCFRGMGQLPWNIQNILVLENMLPAFEDQFISAVKALHFAQSEKSAEILTPLHPIGRERLQALWKSVQSENGKVLAGGEISKAPPFQVQPLVVKDLSHCSTLQQDWIGAPLVLISTVKYAHEMVKWTNTSYYGQVAQIFGPPEKQEKFGAQLEVGKVLGADWIKDLDRMPDGVKQSSLGEMDSWAFGRFFSQSRHIHKS